VKHFLSCWLLCLATFAQQQSEPKAAPLAFDAASVSSFVTSPGVPVRSKMSGGPASPDPGRIDYQGVTFGVLIQRAYGLPFYRLALPAWMNSQCYSVQATIPAGTVEPQFRLMLQKLLSERFLLKSHMEIREVPVYKLVEGKNGVKFKVWGPADDSKLAETGATSGTQKTAADADGYPILPPNVSFSMLSGHARVREVKEKMANFAEFLSGVADLPVIDKTGLDGEYGFTLSWIMKIPGTPPAQAGTELGPDLFEALERQLGLKLEASRTPIEMLVVDSAEKTPVAN
jgi:uncharacterized protein (TIGR03435 family)